MSKNKEIEAKEKHIEIEKKDDMSEEDLTFLNNTGKEIKIFVKVLSDFLEEVESPKKYKKIRVKE